MKYTVITGASSGIGYETAIRFSKIGKSMILVARRTERLNTLKEKLLKANPKIEVLVVSADLSNSENVYKLFNDLREYDVETWINNAGLGDSVFIADESVSKIENMIKVNIEALTILSTLYVQDYKNQVGAQLINVSSAMGYSIALGNTVYSATKFYVSAFTEGLAQELKGFELKVKILAPAITETEFIDKANDIKNFDYNTGVNKFHTAKEMAEFLFALYESDYVLGIIDENYTFNLREGIFPILGKI